MSLIGRKPEQQILEDCLYSDQSEFVVIYGRRRVGKTYLVKEFFNDEFAFHATGVNGVNTREQLAYFNDSLIEYGAGDKKIPGNWREAFLKLKNLLLRDDIKKDPLTGKVVVFLDELPQIDLIIDRMDNVINICEMKCTSDPFIIDSAYESSLTHKLEIFSKETRNRKTLHLTLITASGLERNKHSNMVINTLTRDDLFL